MPDVYLFCMLHVSYLFQIWREYDTDGSGYIEADELKVNNCVLLYLLIISIHFKNQS